MNYQLIQQMNYPQQMNYSQIQNNQNYNDISQQLNNEKLKNKKLEEEIQRLKNKINELKNNNNNLMNENNSLKQRLRNLNQFNQLNQMNQFNQMHIYEINNLRQIIIQKDKEINELKSKMPNSKVYMNDIMVINFLSIDQNIRCGISCLADDTFAEVEEKLYKKFNEFRNTNNILLFGGNTILRFKKVRENNIHDGDTILVKPE